MENRHEKYMEIVDNDEKESEAFWNSLSEEDQLKAFCAVSRRIYQGELVEQGTYRYVLYDVFGFNTDSYRKGMDCGYFAIHNILYDGMNNSAPESLDIPET